jgi:predicted nicotinamide N-methyase
MVAVSIRQRCAHFLRAEHGRCHPYARRSFQVQETAASSNEKGIQHVQSFTLPPGANPQSDQTGLSIWGSAAPLLRHLQNSNVLAERGNSLNVLELGAGCGKLGLGLAAAGATVVLTDHSDAIGWLQKNVSLNRDIVGDRTFVRPLTWGSLEDMAAIESSFDSFDLIVGSDLLYNEETHAALIATMKRFAAPTSAPVYLGYPPRSASEEAFLDRCQEDFEVSVERLDLDTAETSKAKTMLATCKLQNPET